MNKDEILEMICKHTVSSRVEEGTDLIHEVYVNDFVDELLKAINFTDSSLPFKEKETLSFDKWITLERTRVEFYEGCLNGDKNCSLGTLYRKYKNEVLNL